MNKKVILIPGNTDLNRGDQALVWESVNVIKDIYDNPEVILMKGDDHRQFVQTEKMGYPMIKAILKHPARIFSQKQKINYSKTDVLLIGLVAVFDLLLTSLLLARCRIVNKFALLFMGKESTETFETFRHSDAIFVKGGGFIHSYGAVTDAYQMYYLLFYILLGIRHKKNVVVLPNSIGPLKSKLASRLADFALKRCRYVSLRESVSLKFMESRQYKDVPITLHSDLGYYLTASDLDSKAYLTNRGVDMSCKKVVITLRPYRFPGNSSSSELYEKYINGISDFSKLLVDKGYQIVFFSHTLGPSVHENDTIAIKEVCDKLETEKCPFIFIEDETLTCRDVMALYSCFDCLIGTRFHSVIFAQNSLVPTIAITYGGNKGVGIMEDSGLKDFSIPMEYVTCDELKIMFEHVEGAKDKIVNKLKTNRGQILLSRETMVKEIKSLIGSF